MPPAVNRPAKAQSHGP